MGRTNPTYRDTLRALQDRWSDFERALRCRDKPHFEHLFQYAHRHADAGGYQNHDEPLFPVILSILLEQEKQMQQLETRLEELESACEDD